MPELFEPRENTGPDERPASIPDAREGVDCTVSRGRYNYGLSLGIPLTSSGGNNGDNRAARTLFGFANYDISEACRFSSTAASSIPPISTRKI